MGIRKLTEEQVYDICDLFEKGMSNKEIGVVYNVATSTISNIRCGNCYRNVTNRTKNDSKKLTEAQVHEICKIMEDEKSNKVIAEKFDVSERVVSNIRCGRTYLHISKKYDINKSHVYKTLENEVVHRICQLLEDGMPNTEISKICDVNTDAITNIRCGKSYKQISEKYDITRNHVSDKIDDDVVNKICMLLENGQKNIDVSIACDVSPEVVSGIRCGLIHQDISKKYNIEKTYNMKRKISDETLHEVCRLIDEGYKNVDISRLTNLPHSTIGRIKNTDYYADIACNYNFYKNKKNKECK